MERGEFKGLQQPRKKDEEVVLFTMHPHCENIKRSLLMPTRFIHHPAVINQIDWAQITLNEQALYRYSTKKHVLGYHWILLTLLCHNHSA